MQDNCSFPFGCATTHSSIAEWCGYIKAVMSHPDLAQDQKYLWMWLVAHSADQSHHSCSFTYEQISRAVELSPKTVHCALFKLRIMGFLNGNIPVWYGHPTPEMNKEIRTLRPILVSEEAIVNQQIIKKLRQENLLYDTLDINRTSKIESH